jgi:deoxyribonuclease V
LACRLFFMQTDYSTISPEEAIRIQKELRQQIQLQPLPKPVQYIAGADISFNKYSPTVYAGIVVMQYPSLQVVDKAGIIDTATFPYIPGLLAFREVPALIKAWEQLTIQPDVLVLDGHGIAHPRRMGIATHFGVLMNVPALGCAKSLLTGKYTEPENQIGAYADLNDKGELIGKVLRTKKNCKPVYVSPGNMITMDESLELILQCIRKYRIPEPTRLAHNYVNELRRANMDLPAEDDQG